MELEAWIRSFEARHWESLSSIFGDLPSGMQESLRCCVNGTSLPLSLVLQQVASCNNPPKATEIEVTMPPPINPGASSTAGAEAAESRWARPTRRVTFSETDHQTERSRSPMTARSRSPLARPRNGRECPICHATPQHMRSHVEQDHLPSWFHPEVSCLDCRKTFPTVQVRRQHGRDRGHSRAIEAENGEDFLRWARSIQQLLSRIVDHLGLTGQEELALYFYEKGWCPTRNSGVQFNSTSQFLLMDIASVLRTATVLQLNCTQPQHCIEILHWVTLCNFLADQSRGFCREVHQMPLVPTVAEDTLGTLGLPLACDSHCHLAKFVEREGASIRQVLESTLASRFVGPNREMNTPRVQMIIDNRPFTAEWDLPSTEGHHRVTLPGQVFGNTTVKVSYGVHPKEKPPIDWSRFERLVRSDGCVAVGECGLDYTVRSTLQERQSTVFRRQVVLAKAHDKRLILHLRPAGRRVRPVLDEAISILDRERLARHHPIHLHSYVGDFDDYRMWISRYPNTIFGISVASLSASQDFLRLADMKHLVLESDSPHMKDGGRRTTPYDLARQAGFLSRLRGIPLRTVFMATYSNAVQFYS